MRDFTKYINYLETIRKIRKFLYNNDFIYNEIETSFIYDAFSSDVMCSFRSWDEEAAKELLKWLQDNEY